MDAPREANPDPLLATPVHPFTPAPDHLPSPAVVLGWVAAAGGPWFPSRHAAAAGVPRDSLDEPLNALRNAGLVQVVEWVRGVGQGYAVTPDGEKLVGQPDRLAAALAGDRPPPPSDPVPTVIHATDTPPPRAAARRPTTFDRGEQARQAALDPSPAVVTPILVAANVAWFLVGLVAAWRSGASVGGFLAGQEVTPLLRTGGLSGPQLAAGEWWRLVSACFVHVGLLHLLLNAASLGLVGRIAEGLWGRWRFVAVYLASAVAGNCLVAAYRPDAMAAGASGAIWGVTASIGTWLLRYGRHLPEGMAAEWSWQLAIALGLNALISFVPGVGWEGHLGGGLAGFATAWLLNAGRWEGGWRAWAGAAAAAALLVGCVGGLVAYAARIEAWKPVRVEEGWKFRRATLAEIDPGVVNRTHGAVMESAETGADSAGAAEKVWRLDDAARAAGRVAESARWRLLPPGLAARVAAYAEAVAAHAAVLRGVLDDPAGDLSVAFASRRAVMERWGEVWRE